MVNEFPVRRIGNHDVNTVRVQYRLKKIPLHRGFGSKQAGGFYVLFYKFPARRIGYMQDGNFDRVLNLIRDDVQCIGADDQAFRARMLQLLRGIR